MPIGLSRFTLCAVLIPVFAGGWRGASEAAGAQEPAAPGALRRLTVAGGAERVVVEVTADRAIAGTLQALGSPPSRLFVDLQGVVPEIPDRTEVGLGAVQRVRVALNQSQPPVTRVVLDLQGTARYRLEQGATPREIRITVEPAPGPRAAAGDAPRPPAPGPRAAAADAPRPAADAPPAGPYPSWFADATRTLARLIDQTSGGGPTAAGDPRDDERVVFEWSALQDLLTAVTPPPTLESAHALLLTAGAVGHAAVTMAREHLSAADLRSAVAGAAMLMRRAEELAASRPAGEPADPCG